MKLLDVAGICAIYSTRHMLAFEARRTRAIIPVNEPHDARRVGGKRRADHKR